MFREYHFSYFSAGMIGICKDGIGQVYSVDSYTLQGKIFWLLVKLFRAA